MKRVLIIIFILAVVIGATVFSYQYYRRPVESQSLEEDPTVEIVEVGRETLFDTVEASGRLEPKAEVDMKFEIGGMVADVLVERGQPVTVGTVLARLDTKDLEVKIRRAEISLAQREAEREKIFEPELAVQHTRQPLAPVLRVHLGEKTDAPQIEAQHRRVVSGGAARSAQHRTVAAQNDEQIQIGDLPGVFPLVLPRAISVIPN